MRSLTFCRACSACRRALRLDCYRASCPCPGRHWHRSRRRWTCRFRSGSASSNSPWSATCRGRRTCRRVAARGAATAWYSALCICEGAGKRLRGRRCDYCELHGRSFRLTMIIRYRKPGSAIRFAKLNGFTELQPASNRLPPGLPERDSVRSSTPVGGALLRSMERDAISSALWCHISASASNRQLSRG